MTRNIKKTPENLNPAKIPLSGRHLIEASAGTGKTFNITRLYLRLLLEKELTVQQILVMTFTKAATEELRGRIDKEVRDALRNWDVLVQNEPFFQEINHQLSEEQALKRESRLQAALLELDDASIYTIHGFCSRALTSQAFSSGISMELSMESDTTELLMESVRDWLRKIAQNESEFELIKEKNWHLPDKFLSTFYRALTTSQEMEALKTEQLSSTFIDDYHNKKYEFLSILKNNEKKIFEEFVLVHDGVEALKKSWPLLIEWFESNIIKSCSMAEGDFLKQKPLTKKVYAEIKQLLRPVYDFKQNYNKELKKYNDELKKHNDALRSQIVVQAINSIREGFTWAKEQATIMDFDDLITYLSQRVQSDEGQDLVSGLRNQYKVALVDEFQDTDPNQYAILDTLYPKSDPQLALYMIGDPKQAIYAFRGGDIFTYLKASEGAELWNMDTNWRSVEGVVTGYNRLFIGRPINEASYVDVFGYDIAYAEIKHTPKAEAASCSFYDPNEQMAAINYCWLPEVANPSGAEGKAKTDDFKVGLAQWCVSEISRLLTDSKLAEESLQEKDIAILVRTGTEAQIMRDALSKADFPSVYLSEKENIFKSTQAKELLLVLKGVLDSENDGLLVAALSTFLMGGNAEQLALYHEQGSEQAWEEQRDRVVQLREIWVKKGCMSMLMQLIGHDYQPEPSQHERSLTNMIHLAELLQQASRQYKHPQQLLKWFTAQCQTDKAQEEAQLRLESDASLIRIVTQHGSKGLEYPFVFIPFASSFKDPVRFGNTLHEYFEYHAPKTYQAKCQIGQSDEAIELATSEGEAEAIRLLYVAITRATHRCYLGIAPFKDSIKSPLGLTLKLTDVACWEETLQQLVNTSDGSSALIKINDSETQVEPRSQPIDNREQLLVSILKQPVDDRWSLNSFSSLMRDTHSVRQEQKDRIDEGLENAVKVTADKSLRFTLRKGADTGNLLHDILEHTNFTSTQDWPLETPLRRYGGLPETEQEELTLWLQDCLDTPLPAIESETEVFKLSELSWSQTLRESEFYFPMQDMKLDSLSHCLQKHRGNNTAINLPEKEQLLGMMRGYIDLIFENNGRFYVVDYKSTHLGDQLENYHWQALKENNQLHYYDLQYLIYSLALHRYLGTRIPDYDPKLHFGGVYYLYLRGMSIKNDKHYGIYHTAIDISLLNQLDKVFQGKVIKEDAA